MPKIAADRPETPLQIPAEASPTAGRAMFQPVVDALPEPACVIDRAHRWVAANAAYAEFVGTPVHDLLGRTVRALPPSTLTQTTWRRDEAAFRQGASDVEDVLRYALNAPRIVHTHRAVLHDDAGRDFLLCIVRDVTGDAVRARPDAAAFGRNIRRLGVHRVRYGFTDPLTQLANRRAMMRDIESAVCEPGPGFCVLVVNIDRLKLVNDRFGHACGDTVILETAARLHAAVAGSGKLGRLDNDEFVVLAPGRELLAIERFIERIQGCTVPPLMLGDYAYRLSLTVGVARSPGHGGSAEELIRNARLALRWCKRRQRGGSEVYAPAISVAEERTTGIELALPAALADGALVAHFQPIVRRSDHATVAYETLLRWHDAELGDVSPAEFVPVAEGMGLIGRVGISALEQACAFLAGQADDDIAVSVNVSSSQVLDEAFPIAVAELLQTYNLCGDRLILEITETVAMRVDAVSNRVFHELSLLGVRLFIDDFGTGFSNLVRLKALPFAGIKIDREFVRGLPASETDAAIFRATHALARALNFVIVVEGVENRAQESFIAAFDVEYLQGYRFGRARPFAQAGRDRRPGSKADGA